MNTFTAKTTFMGTMLKEGTLERPQRRPNYDL
jgi:hypothetical protein